MSLLNTQQIMEILPHRNPFLLIDTIEELVPGEKAVAKKNVTMNEPYFRDIFRETRSSQEFLSLKHLPRQGRLQSCVRMSGKEKQLILQE